VDRFSHMDFEEFNQQLKDKAAEQAEILSQLGQNVNAEELFVVTGMTLSIGPADEMSEATHGTVSVKTELLAYELYPHFGSSDEKVTPFHINYSLHAAEALLMSTGAMAAKDIRQGDEQEALVRQIERNARIIRGSAFQEQTAAEILGVQAQFDRWFEEKVGISPTRAQEAIWKLQDHGNELLHERIGKVLAGVNESATEWRRMKKIRPKSRLKEEQDFLSRFPKSTHAEHGGWVAGLIQFVLPDYPVKLQELGYTDAEAAGLESLVGMTSEYRERMTDPVEIKQRPLYFLNDKRIVVYDIANAMDALWDAFESVVRSDQGIYDKYQAHKGRWLEQKTVEYLGQIFPTDSIYRGLSYPDLAKGAGATTELDIAVSFGPFLILVEAKSAQFRIEGQLGDVGRLRTDLVKNVQDAYDQAKRAAGYIQATDYPEFTEIKTGRRLQINKSKVKKTFLMTVSLHQLSGLATTLGVFKNLGLFTQSEYPFSIAISDLEFVSEFTKYPDVFLHYIERRLAVQGSSLRISIDEADFLGAYLDTRFARPLFWERDNEEFNAVAIGGFSAVFDNLMLFRRGYIQEDPNIRLDIPPEIEEILAQLRKIDDDHSRSVGFETLDLSKNQLIAIARLLRDFRNAELTFGRIRRVAADVDGLLIVGTAATGVSAEEFIERSKEIFAIEKYNRKSQRGFLLSVAPKREDSVFEFIDYSEQPWVYDARIEKLIGDQPAKVLTANAKRKPNQPCFCGSGRKFKKCCAAIGR
jgi:hypothetical protein